MLKNSIKAQLTIFSLLTLYGCAADQHAQQLSKEILIQVIEYDEELENLNRILIDDFAKERRKSLEKASLRGGEIALQAETDKLAVEAVDNILLRGFLISDIERFVLSSRTIKQERENKVKDYLASFYSKQQSILEKTKQKRDKIKTLKAVLGDLQSAAPIGEEIEKLSPLIKAAFEAQQENKE
jgi:hypothetical protein